MIPEFFPRDRYYCVLDEQPDLLVDPHALAPYASLNGSAPLVVNPRCWMGWHGPLPTSFANGAEIEEGLYTFPWMIWVDDVERGALWPYWLGPDYARMLEGLVTGQPYAGGLPPEMEMNLRIADILVTPDAMAWRRHAWASTVETGAPMMARGHIPMEALFPPFHVGALRRYYRYHTRIGSFALGDEQTSRRFVAYDEPVTRYFHRQLARTVSDMVRRVVVPSYSYLAFYQGGAVLDPHTDRDACEYTLSVCIDATPDPHTYGAWPLQLMTADGPVALTQGVGDGLLFRGRELTHWRERLPEGYTSSSILFHFVDAPT